MDSSEWHCIVAYRDFHDVPRCVLAANKAGDAFWILDAVFEETVDEYSTFYTIHGAGNALGEAMAKFKAHAGKSSPLPAIGCIPVTHVQFDETCRSALRLTSQPIR